MSVPEGEESKGESDDYSDDDDNDAASHPEFETETGEVIQLKTRESREMFEQLKREREKFKVSADRIASLTEEYTVL